MLIQQITLGMSSSKKPNRQVLRTLVFACVCGYFIYVLYWFAKTIPWVVQISLEPQNFMPPAGLNSANPLSIPASYLMEYIGFAGLAIRLIGACFAIFAALLVFRGEAIFSPRLRTACSRALLLEGLYFFSFIPAIYYLASVATLPLTSRTCLASSLTVQLALIAPTIILLGIKLGKSSITPKDLTKLGVLAALGYVVALWVTYLLKWTEMAALEGAIWLIRAPRVIVFSNTIITFSLATVLALAGTWFFLSKANVKRATTLWGFAGVFLSLHLIIFVLFCVNYKAAYLAIFGELWAIPLISISAYMLYNGLRKR